jgi:hypothetical protein
VIDIQNGPFDVNNGSRCDGIKRKHYKYVVHRTRYTKLRGINNNDHRNPLLRGVILRVFISLTCNRRVFLSTAMRSSTKRVQMHASVAWQEISRLFQ